MKMKKGYEKFSRVVWRMGGIGNTMDKRQADINSRIEMEADNTSDTDFEQKQSDSFRIKTETVTESDSQKSDVKTTSKDSVFRDLFGDRKYALQLYQAIHPEDTDVTEADIGNVTIKNIFTDQQYTDLGMTVRGKLLLMLDAQSSWTVNIIIRIFLSLALTWNEYIGSS